MGCCGSSAAAAEPAAGPACRTLGFSRSPEHGDAPSMDDLGWLFSENVDLTERNVRRVDVEGLRLQIELPKGWKDLSLEETEEIVERLNRGETSFQLQARGQTYELDFSSRESAKQLNVATGKERRLRFLDVDDEDPGSCSGHRIDLQVQLGPQSKRGGASQHPFRILDENPHAQECFARFAQNEARLCGEWAVFYHSYSFAALVYEVQAAVGSVLFRFRSQYATLPRILVGEFDEIRTAKELVKRYEEEFQADRKDHHPSFRRVALSVMCSLASTGPEACLAMVFIAGYSCKDLSFRKVLENLLEKCYVPKAKVKRLAEQIIAMSEKHGLDVSQFGGKACQSGKAGHLLQIFIKRHLVDRLVYAAKPYGPVDEERMPISEWMNSGSSFSLGQARIVAHPKHFMQAKSVRMFVASADPTFHRNRRAFQEELVGLLAMILGEPSLREHAASGIYGGTLPSWWTAEDQRKLALA